LPPEIRTMSEPTPVPPTEEAKKRLREKVEKLLARDPCKSEASIVLNGRTLTYRSVAEFIPVAAGGATPHEEREVAGERPRAPRRDRSNGPSSKPTTFVMTRAPRGCSVLTARAGSRSRRPCWGTVPSPA